MKVVGWRSLVVCGVALTACGLDVQGSEGAPDAGAPTGPGSTDGAVVDAGGLPPPCTQRITSVDATFDAIDNGAWLKTTNDPTFPKIASLGGNDFVSLLDDKTEKRGALWYRTPVETRAIDLDIEVAIRCKTQNCGDGLAIVWLEAPNVDDMNVGLGVGQTFGIPEKRLGGGLAFDLYQNMGTDPPAPYVGVLSVDPRKAPTDYDWTSAETSPITTLTDGVKKLSARLRNGELVVSIGGTEVVRGPTIAGFRGIFGITAASGGAKGEFFVRNLRARFYACTP